MGKALGIIALIFGILGMTIGWLLDIIPFLPYARFYLPIVALVCGIVGTAIQEKKGMAIAGLVLGAVGIVLAIFIFPFLLYLIEYLFLPPIII